MRCNITPRAKALDGWQGGFQPKPAVEVIIVAMKRKPCREVGRARIEAPSATAAIKGGKKIEGFAIGDAALSSR